MTPEEIYAATARYEHLVQTFDRTRSFREYLAERRAIAGELLACAASGGENAALARDRFDRVASDKDAAGLYLHLDDLTLDHSPADQQAYLRLSFRAEPLGDHPSDVQLLAEGSRLGDEVMEWVSRHRTDGTTYRQFWDDYRVAAAEFEAFLQRPDLPDRMRENATMVHDVALRRGLDPESHFPAKSLDDLIGFSVPSA